MATPTTNFVPTTVINPASTGLGRYVVDGTKWGGGLGAGVTLTYSFPGAPTAYFLPPYSEFSTWYSMSTSERSSVREGLSAWSGLAKVSFTEVSDNASTVGELRFAKTNMADFAHAYTPSNAPKAGDTWFKQGSWNSDGGSAPKGSYDYVTIMHEIGHALGLKHSFASPNVMPSQWDNYFYTIMSYTAKGGVSGNYASFYPTTPMYFDLIAIQALYGPRAHNTGSNTYTFVDGRTYFQTLYDTGGTDKIAYSGSDPCRIDLNIGHYCQVSEPISFGDSSTSRATVWIGPGTNIENAQGGSGNDVLVGNALANALYGGGGNDVLIGGRGHDNLSGGSGRDRFDFNSVAESVKGAKHDNISSFSPAQHDHIDLSTIDADTSHNPGNDKFKFIGSAHFHGGGGEVRVAGALVQADTNGDKIADLEIHVTGAHLHAGDFIL